jgi:hypothetical protein
MRARPLFPRWSNGLLWAGLASFVGAGIVVFALLFMFVRSAYATGQRVSVEQPVKFDHRHHVRDDGIPCLYCHGGAERGAAAGVPATSTCMNCHSQIWTKSPELALVRASYFEDRPIRWRRVNAVPDFVFFNHSVHLAKGIGCVSCHGRVDKMPEVYAVQPLSMGWCLDCHRNPVPHLVPREHVADPTWTADRPQEELGRELARRYAVAPPTDCSGCHR